MELDQVDEDRPLDLQQQVLLVFLKLRMEPVNDPLAAGLGTLLALQNGLERIEPPGQLLAQSGEGLQDRLRADGGRAMAARLLV